MVQIKNFLIVTMIWAAGMLALTATRAALQSPSSAPVDAGALIQRY